jgi:dCMP deaminase
MPNRPTRIQYYLGQAIAVAARAECQGQHVGAVIVGSGNRVLSTGYNGAPEGWGNCSDGDVCPRCDRREHFGSGNAYDKCICVHAEMNAISAAARYGVALDGATVYVTHQPCFTCAKEMIQAGISSVYYGIALPVAAPSGPDDVDLRQTEARLLGQLRAVHVETCSAALAGLRQAEDRFKSESGAASIRSNALQEVPSGSERPARNGKPNPRPRTGNAA